LQPLIFGACTKKFYRAWVLVDGEAAELLAISVLTDCPQVNKRRGDIHV
jgi:hypothetical protein